MKLALAVALSLLVACTASDDIPAPQVSNVVPDHASPGSVVVISGAYFCQQPPDNDGDPICNITGTVEFGTVPGTPTTWSDTTIMVEVPAGTSGEADVSVTAAGRASNSVGFTAD